MAPNGENIARQLWGPVHTTTSYRPHCTPFTLPSGGIVDVNGSNALTLTSNALFSPQCSSSATSVLTSSNDTNSTVINFRDPFYASIAPQFFAIAIATVISYLLVIIIFITPGTSFVNGSGGGASVLGRRANFGGSYGGSSVVVIGRRPWLQKIAALTVLISLTIACADTFKFAERQYDNGYSDAAALVDEVNASLEIRVTSVLSDTVVWLAQVQTLIRLFPRHKEKVAIKWLGFALILFDTVFDILNNFVYQSPKSRPRRFQDAIPALSYLFELAIALIYAACVMYYSLSKRRFAFWHAKMKNICLVALLSLMAVLTPIVFFVLDVSKPDVAGWGGYIRWVGAAAASVVVWEWVERIEALERDERKDGILGREIFDGDEMLDMMPSEEVVWQDRGPNRRNDDGRSASNTSGWGDGNTSEHRPLRSRVPFQSRHVNDASGGNLRTTAAAGQALPASVDARHPALPPQAITPISRTDTSSASTIYAVRRLTLNSPSPRIPEDPGYATIIVPKEKPPAESEITSSEVIHIGPTAVNAKTDPQPVTNPRPRPDAPPLWRAVPNPFKRKRASPPAEVVGAQSSTERRQSQSIAGLGRRPNFRSRIDALTAPHRARAQGHAVDSAPTVTIIPAQRRGQRTCFPSDLSHLVSDEVDHASHLSGQDQNDDQNGLQPSEDSANVPVTIIPAPVRGQRTWSPQDLINPSPDPTLHRSPTNDTQVPLEHHIAENGFPTMQGIRPEPSSEQTGTNPTNGPRTCLSRRGTLIISEDEARTSSGPYRRSLYARTAVPLVRPGSTPVSPHVESVVEDQKVVEQERSAALGPAVDVAVLSNAEIVPPPESPRNDPAG